MLLGYKSPLPLLKCNSLSSREEDFLRVFLPIKALLVPESLALGLPLGKHDLRHRKEHSRHRNGKYKWWRKNIYERRSVVRNDVWEVAQTSVLVCLTLCTSPTPTHGSVNFRAMTCSFLVCFFISVAIILEMLNKYYFFFLLRYYQVQIYIWT